MAISTTRRTRCAAVLLPLALLTACGGDDEPAASGATPSATSSPTSTAPKSTCHEAGDREVTLTGPGGASTFAVGVGEGTRAVLLLHEAQQNHCRWMPFARTLAAKGVQVWSVDSAASSNALSLGENGSLDPSQDLVRMAAYVREQGVSEVVVAGASMGGVGAIVAAGKAQARRVASLSAPTEYNVDALPAARELAVPLLLVAGDQDGDFPAAARTLAKAATKAKVTLLPVPTGAHGTDMLTDPVPQQGGRPVGDVLAAFLLG